MDFFLTDYFEFLKNNNNNFDKLVQTNLIDKFIDISQTKEEFEYSFIINIFIISFISEKIDKFLEVFEQINIHLDDKIENNIFNYILDIYNKNKNLQNEQSSKSIDNFITIYQLFYKDPSKIDKQKLIDVKPIIIKLIIIKKK